MSKKVTAAWALVLGLGAAALVAWPADVPAQDAKPDAKPEAKRYTENFLSARAPKYLGYFETVLKKSGGTYALGRKATYMDLSLFQLIEGLRYAFPNAMKRIEREVPRVVAVRDRMAERKRIKDYLASPRRIPFNESGIFRHYPELDE
jgi:glutathione S-transferase